VASRQAGAIISAGARAGDAVLYSHDPERWWVPRDLVAHYVPPGRRPSDVLAVRAQRTGGTAAAVLCADVLACLGDTGRVWVLQVRPQPGEDDPLDGLDERSAALLRGRYAVDQVWRPTGLTIALLVRSW
jgi:mannosyltransferase